MTPVGSLPEMLAVLGAGLAAGVLTSTVGVASLVSFPSCSPSGCRRSWPTRPNTVGLVPAGVSGSIGYRAELREHPRIAATVVLTCAVGAVGGAALLLALPSSVFQAVVPWLILFTCLLVGVQPWVARWLRSRAGEQVDPRTRMGPVTTFFALLTGVYGGYFGAGSGVMMVAVLGLGLDIDLRVVNALKTLAIFAGNVVAGLVFVTVADLDWRAIALLARGGRRRLPPLPRRRRRRRRGAAAPLTRRQRAYAVWPGLSRPWPRGDGGPARGRPRRWRGCGPGPGRRSRGGSSRARRRRATGAG